MQAVLALTDYGIWSASFRRKSGSLEVGFKPWKRMIFLFIIVEPECLKRMKAVDILSSYGI
jgi:hypothetical protein